MPWSNAAPGERSSTALVALAAVVALGLSACATRLLPPSADLQAPATGHVGVAVQLDGSGSAPAPRDEGLPVPVLSFEWSFRGKPAGSRASLSSAFAVAPRFVPDVAGDYVVRLVVADWSHRSAPVERTISVAADCVPRVTSVSASPAAPTAGEAVSLSAVSVSPCDGLPGAGADPLVAIAWTLEQRPPESRAVLTGADRPRPSLVPDVRGRYVVSARVTDRLGNASDASLSEARAVIDVRACGDSAPEVRSLAAVPAQPRLRAPVQLSADVVHADEAPACGQARTLWWSWSLVAAPPGSQAALNDAGARTPSFTPDLEGAYAVALEVRDERGRASARRLLELSVPACGGAVPGVAIAAPASARTGAPVQLAATVQDADAAPACGRVNGYTYSWRLVAAPVGSQAALADPGLSNPTLLPDVPGTYGLAVEVASSNGRTSATAYAAVLAGPCGAALPEAGIVAPAGARSGAPVRLSATVTDANDACATTAPFAFRWALVGRPRGSASALEGALADGASLRAATSFVPDAGGSYVAELEVTDALGRTSPRVQRTIEVADCRAPLTASIAPATGVTGSALTLQATVDDPNAPGPGSACTAPVAPYSWRWALTGQPAGSRAALANPRASSPSLVPDVAGDYRVQLLVEDAAGNVAPAAAATVRVADCSAPLVASFPAAPPWAGAPTGQPVALAVEVADPNAPSPGGCVAQTAPFSYSWTLLAAPAGSAARLQLAGTPTPVLLPDLRGTYLVSVVVQDAAGNRSAPALTTVEAADCNAPLGASIVAPAGVVTGAPVQLSAGVTDPNAGGSCTAPVDPLRWAWTLAARPPQSAAALNAPQGSAPSFTPDRPGTYTVTLQVTDAAGNRSAIVSRDLVAGDCTRPLDVSIPAQSGLRTNALVALSATAPAPQPAGGACGAAEPLRWSWRLDARPAGSAASLDDPTAATPAFVPDLPGTYLAAVTVRDALGNAGTATRALIVTGCASSGGISATVSHAPAAPEVGQPVTASAALSDANAAACGAPTAAPFGYLWTLEAPPGSSAVLSGARLAQPSFVPDVAGGPYRLRVTVTDALGASAALPAHDLSATARCAFAPSITAPGAAALTFFPVALSGAVGGACQNPVSLRWSFDAVPVGSQAQLAGADTLAPSFTPDVPNGRWTVRFTVTDRATGVQTSRTADVTSNGCGSQPPVATAGISLPFPIIRTTPQPDPNTGSSVQYLLNASPAYELQLDGTNSADPGAACAGPLSYRWIVYSRPVGSINQLQQPAAARPVFTPDAGVPGDYTFELEVSNGRFTSGPSYLRITVMDPLDDWAPGVPSGANRNVRWNDSAAEPVTGNPSLAYYQRKATGNKYDLFFTRCTAACATATATWSAPEKIDDSILDDGDAWIETAQVSLKYVQTGASAWVPAVAYRRTSSCQMYYAWRGAAGAWSTSAIENVGGGCSSIHGEIDLLLVGTNGFAGTGTPAAAYHSHVGTTRERYAICTGNCTSATSTPIWVRGDISTNGNIGHYTTTFVDPVSRLPRAAYQENASTSLYYATCAGAGGNKCDTAAFGTWTERRILDGSGGNNPTGYWNSMALDSTGKPGIAFEEQTGGSVAVRLARCTANCSDAATSSWTFSDIATGIGSPSFPKLQFDAQDRVRVSYIDAATQKLRYAVQGAGGTFQFYDIDTQVDDGHSSFILTPAGSTHVSYALTTGLKYYPFGD